MFNSTNTDQLGFNLIHGNNQSCGITFSSKLPQHRLKTAEWPPCFDGNGASYVFDAVSSMFYEPRSNFFYDPKTSLYYGNEKKAYYRFNNEKSPPFEEVLASNHMKTLETCEDSSVFQEIQCSEPDCNQLSEEKSKKLKTLIMVNLKTKQMKTGPSTKTSNEFAPVKTHEQKTQIANIEKWNKISEEVRTEQVELESRRETKKAKLLMKHSRELNQEVERVRKTTKGEPICFICMRKFLSLSKLRLHETASQLHKDNVQKRLQISIMHDMTSINPFDIHLSAGEPGKDMRVFELLSEVCHFPLMKT